MAYTNSTLATHVQISPNRTVNRTHKIDTITVHCYVGQVTAAQGCEWLCNPKAKASANYVVGKDGSIALNVPESDRAWTSSNRDNDMRAITVEVASDKTSPYAVTDAAYAALIDLLVDVCRRNDIPKLLWRADKSLIGQVDMQNMTLHKWFKNKACPGPHLEGRMGDIADQVNYRLGLAVPKSNTLYRVQVGAYRKRVNAEAMTRELKDKGFDAYVVESGG